MQETDEMDEEDSMVLELRGTFLLFFVQAFSYLEPATQLRVEPYLEYICNRYQKFGKRERVVLNLPARCLKTRINIAYAAWFLGRNPSRSVMIVSNKQDLAEMIIKDLREMITSDWYKKVFPKTEIKKGHSNASRFTTTRRGAVIAASVEGSVAGYGADLMIVDDPNKIQDANRSDRLDAVNEKFDGELYSRLNNKKRSQVIVVQHRLNANDLSGHLIERGYKQIAFPLIAPKNKEYKLSDKSIWHRKKGSLLTNTYTAKDIEAAKISTTLDFHWFYQQGVGTKTNKTISVNDIDLVDSQISDGPFIISIDASQSDHERSSYNVIQVWQKLPNSYHLFQQFRAQCDFAELQTVAKSYIKKFRPTIVLIEAAASGVALLNVLMHRMPNFKFKSVHPRESKAARLNRHRDTIRQGKLSLQMSEKWTVNYVLEITEFPNCGTDQVDATTQFLDFAEANPVWPSSPPPAAAIAGVGSDGRPLTFTGSTQSGVRGIAIATVRPLFRRF